MNNPLGQVREEYIEKLKQERVALDETSICAKIADREIERVSKGGEPTGHENIHSLRPIKFVNYVGKLLGPKGATLRQLQDDTQTRLAIMGQGSQRDQAKEAEQLASGEAKFAHLKEPLHVRIEALAPVPESYRRVAIAMNEIRKYFLGEAGNDQMGGGGGYQGDGQSPMGRGGGRGRGPPRGGGDRGGRGGSRGGGRGPPRGGGGRGGRGGPPRQSYGGEGQGGGYGGGGGGYESYGGSGGGGYGAESGNGYSGGGGGYGQEPAEYGSGYAQEAPSYGGGGRGGRGRGGGGRGASGGSGWEHGADRFAPY